jgi:hypothetical protein
MRKGKDSRHGLPPLGLTSPYIGLYRGQADALEAERQRLKTWRRKSGQLKRQLLIWLEISLIMLLAFGLYLSGVLA